MKAAVSASAVVALLSVYLYIKLSPNIPNPDEGVLYYYQCRENERQPLNIDSLKSDLGSSSFENTLFVLIPGYTESSFRAWLGVVSNALLEARPSSCVLFVDHWNYLSLSRPFMTLNVQTIANSIADLLQTLEKQTDLKFSNIHVIGFSLGGWVSGLVSNQLPEGKKIGRITGIDSSFPWHDTSDTKEFLDSEDAEVVVAIRTSKVGLKMPPVKLDFYVNGGRVQPECNIWWYPDFIQQICSHYKAPFLFASHLLEDEASFTSCGCPNRTSLLLKNCQCDVKNSFGLNTLTEVEGNFYLETSNETLS